MSSKSTRRMSKKALDRWKQEFPWVQKYPGGGDVAYCGVCLKTLQPKRDKLLLHHNSNIHNQMIIKFQDRLDKQQADVEQTPSSASITDVSTSPTEANEDDVVPKSDGIQSGSSLHIVSVSSSSSAASSVDPSAQTVSSLSLAPTTETPTSLSSQTATLGAQMAPSSENTLENINTEIIMHSDVVERNEPIRVMAVDETMNNQTGQEVVSMGDSVVVMMNKFPSQILSELEDRIVSDEDTDLIWRCDDASYKVHKLVLALNSPLLKRILMTNVDGDVLMTRDVASSTVRTILCLFYTGRAYTKSEKINLEVLETLKYLECKVDNFYTEVRTSPEHDTISEIAFDDVSAGKSCEKQPQLYRPGKRKVGGPSKPKKSETFLYNFDDSDKEKEAIKVEIDEETSEDLGPAEQPLNRTSNRKRRKLASSSKQPDTKDSEVPDNSKLSDKFRDSKITLHLRGKGRGAKCGRLAQDLFDDGRREVTSISACILCYQYFDDKNSLQNHKNEKHRHDKSTKGVHHISSNVFKCPTCNTTLELPHVVWFIKHLKFCGKDDEKAKDILLLGEDDSPLPSELQQTVEDEDCLTDKRKGKDPIEKLSQFLLGKRSQTIWGCRTCYEVFGSRDELESHRKQEHQGVLRHGSCYDTSSRLYTCQHCNTVIRSTHLVLFIKHLKQCYVDPALGLSKDHEVEGLEDDTTEDTVDPWGVLNKPLRVVNLRSQWVCEALLGKSVPILFPCHVCYKVFGEEQEIKEHFSTFHRDIENCNENGEYYNKENDSFSCPVCRRDVCKKQRTSVYFTYHLTKCQGKDFPVVKTCDKCNQRFSNFRMYLFHEKTSCETQDFICHICSMNLKTNKDLTSHIQYVHTDARPYVCSGCSRTFKRKGDLVVHQQSHNTKAEFSCEHCGKAFNMKKNLKRHIQIHTAIMDRPHQCPHCYLRFNRKQVLENHIATHTPARKFACDICSVKVKTRDALKVHRRKVHKTTTGLPSSTTEPDVKVAPPSTATSEVQVYNTAAADNNKAEANEPLGPGSSGLQMPGLQVVSNKQLQQLQVVEDKGEEYTLAGIKTPASEIPVKDEVIISQFQIITSM